MEVVGDKVRNLDIISGEPGLEKNQKVSGTFTTNARPPSRAIQIDNQDYRKTSDISVCQYYLYNPK